ncbi:AAA family ATPase [Shinella sp. M31]|uniref:AAA family ATPase n=1 Tax=Shinella sp. M31 TaxID=3368615 RepID=UPI003BA08ED5
MKGESPSNLLYPRGAAERIRVALKDTPVVLVNGPRRCGKTILARTLLQTDRPYFTLDDETTLLSAKTDPVGFVHRSRLVDLRGCEFP